MIGSTLGLLDILAVVAVGGGVVLTGIGIRRYRRLRAISRRAVETTGTVQQVDIQMVKEAAGTQEYLPVVDYEYRTPTERRDGNTVYPGEHRFAKLFGTEAAAETAINDYEPGTQTTVYYDPDDPAHSFLIADPQTATAITKVVLGIAILLGGVLLTTL